MRALHRFVLLLPIAVAGLMANARASGSIVEYSFTDGTLNSTSVDANATATAITGSPTVNGQATSVITVTNGIYASAPFITAARATPNESGTRSNVFFSFTLTAKPGETLNLSNFTFNIAQGGGTAGQRDYDIRTSVDNYATSLTGANPVPIATVRPTFTPVNVDLSPVQFQNLSLITMQVRFFAPGVSQNIDFDDLTVNGSVTVAPEPGTSACLLFGGLAVLRRRRRNVITPA